MTLEGGPRLEHLKGLAGPDNNHRIHANRDKYRGVVRPSKILNIIVMSNQALVCFPVLNRWRLVGTKRGSWWTFVEVVYADNLVVGSAGKIATIGREANRVNRAEMVAHMAKLARLVVVWRVGIVNRFGRPNSDVSIAACGRKTFAVGRNMAAVNLEILLLAAMA